MTAMVVEDLDIGRRTCIFISKLQSSKQSHIASHVLPNKVQIIRWSHHKKLNTRVISDEIFLKLGGGNRKERTYRTKNYSKKLGNWFICLIYTHRRTKNASIYAPGLHVDPKRSRSLDKKRKKSLRLQNGVLELRGCIIRSLDCVEDHSSSTAHSSTMSTEIIDPATDSVPAQGIRKNGKQWKLPKAPFKPGTASSSSSSKQSKTYLARQADRLQSSIVKAKEKELKAEKEAIRQQRIKSIKDKRAAKEEKERYEQLAAKMHAKRVERLKRREKRNKLLKER